MGKIVSVTCTSHTPALMMTAERWVDHQEQILATRPGSLPPDLQAAADAETREQTAQHHANCMSNIAEISRHVAAAKPDIVVMFGDDQKENFLPSTMPPFTIFTGEATFGFPFRLYAAFFNEPPGDRIEIPAAGKAANCLVSELAEEGFDVAFATELPDAKWGLSHSMVRIVHLFGIEAPVLPVFVNALYEPAATPRRCYQLGQAIKSAIERCTPESTRIAVIGSGGLSHITQGERAGAVDIPHDTWVMESVKSGQGRKLADLTVADLHTSGDEELREWLPAVAMIEGIQPDYTDLVESWGLVAGHGFAAWDLYANQAA